jgi:hypothetical protein
MSGEITTLPEAVADLVTDESSSGAAIRSAEPYRVPCTKGIRNA